MEIHFAAFLCFDFEKESHHTTAYYLILSNHDVISWLHQPSFFAGQC